MKPCSVSMFALFLAMAVVEHRVVAAAPLASAFTYQGRLKGNGVPFEGTADMEFRLFDSLIGGTQPAPPVSKPGVAVSNGLFTVDLDFGAQPFDGQALFLEVAVKANTAGVFATLAPRQPLTPTPYALRALIDETFALPFDATIPFDFTLFSLANSSATSDFAEAIRGTVTDRGTAVVGMAEGPRGRAGVFGSTDSTNSLAALATFSLGSGSALIAENFGSGPAAEFVIGPGPNVSAALSAETSGDGRAGQFEIQNASNNAAALSVTTNGDFLGTAVRARNTGEGSAGEFAVTNPDSLTRAFVVSTAGRGRAASFFTVNPVATLETMLVENQGRGFALLAQSLQSESAGAGLFFIGDPQRTNPRPALAARTRSLGPAADFTIDHQNSPANALQVATNGLGSAGVLEVSNDQNTAAALKAFHAGVDAGPAAHLVSGGTDPATIPIKATLRAVQLRDQQEGGPAGEFVSLGSLNSDPAVFAGALGRGPAGEFAIQNSDPGPTQRNEADALKATTMGFGRAGLFEILAAPPVQNMLPALEARTDGGGSAGVFAVTNTSTTGLVNNAVALHAKTVGFGSAARFEIDRLTTGTGTDPVNNSPALHVVTNASGQAGKFENISIEGANPTLEVSSLGRGIIARFAANGTTNADPTIVGVTQGTGAVAQFTNFNPANTSATLQVSTNAGGTAGAAVFQNTNPANNGDVVAALANNTHHALFARQSGPGEAAHFEIADPGNFNNAVFIKNNGVGIALSVENGNPNFGALALGVRGKSSFNGQVDILGPTGGPVPVNITGNVGISGGLCATSVCAAVKNFRIDHPLDPANKYLSHSSVESSEMKNIYDGMASLDENGQATITLPVWFEALNESFRYQLTAVGQAAPDLHIAQEITDRQFRIAGGRPGMKVSWQVTGVRHDAYAQAHGLVVEQPKPLGERGKYLAPDADSSPREFGAGCASSEELFATTDRGAARVRFGETIGENRSKGK